MKITQEEEARNVPGKRERLVATILPKRIVVPTDQELTFARKNRQLAGINSSPIAVKVNKFTSRNRSTLNPVNMEQLKASYREICNLYLPDFLLHIQVPEGSKFSDDELSVIEEMQNIPETPFHCSYEKDFEGTAEELRFTLSDIIRKHGNLKEVVPVVEVYTLNNDEKVKVMRELGIKKCAIIYRNYKKYESEWSELTKLLEGAGIYIVVLGVTPRMRKKNKASVLIAPFRFGANAVAHGLPWSGGVGTVRFLHNWIYTVSFQRGSTNYEGSNRDQIVQNITSDRSKYEFSRVDAINEANILVGNFESLTIEQIESLLN
jgi:hypothetical protein